jgi:hypothetical protein
MMWDCCLLLNEVMALCGGPGINKFTNTNRNEGEGPHINFVAWVRERTIQTERSPLVGEVSANFTKQRLILKAEVGGGKVSYLEFRTMDKVHNPSNPDRIPCFPKVRFLHWIMSFQVLFWRPGGWLYIFVSCHYMWDYVWTDVTVVVVTTDVVLLNYWWYVVMTEI